MENNLSFTNFPALRRRIELLQDFSMPVASTGVQVTSDGQYILASGQWTLTDSAYTVSYWLPVPFTARTSTVRVYGKIPFTAVITVRVYGTVPFTAVITIRVYGTVPFTAVITVTRVRYGVSLSL